VLVASAQPIVADTLAPRSVLGKSTGNASHHHAPPSERGTARPAAAPQAATRASFSPAHPRLRSSNVTIKANSAPHAAPHVAIRKNVIPSAHIGTSTSTLPRCHCRSTMGDVTTSHTVAHVSDVPITPRARRRIADIRHLTFECEIPIL